MATQDKIHRTVRGFTIIELVVTVAILGVLLMIAVPAYRDYVVRANRAAAKTFLLEIASKQDQFATTNRAYADCPLPATAAACLSAQLGLTVPAEVDRQYDVTTAAVQVPLTGLDDMRSFTATATPKPGSQQEPDGTLQINGFGLKTPLGKW